jgi:hypothetical protein
MGRGCFLWFCSRFAIGFKAFDGSVVSFGFLSLAQRTGQGV